MIGAISFMMGYNEGLEAGEYEWPLNLIRFFVLGLVTVQVLGTIWRRKERRFYVAMWYTVAAMIWTMMKVALGGLVLPYAEQVTGVNSAALHGLYIHYIVGLWLTPAGLALIYYFLPSSTKNVLHSHRLSLLGFWTLASFLPVRRHPSLSLQSHSTHVSGNCDRHQHAVDHSGLGCHGEFLRDCLRPVGPDPGWCGCR